MLNSVEDFVNSTSTEPNTLTIVSTQTRESVIDFALGISAGAKFITKRNFVVQFSLGAGRNLFRNDRSLTIVPKAAISLGYRF